MKAKLVVVGGEAKAGEFELNLPTIIGRGREVSLTLPHPLVSREHCEIYQSNGRLFVRDLGSLNGTFINNQRIEGEAELPAGELLTIGTVTFRADYEIQPGQPSPGSDGKLRTSRASAAGTVADARLESGEDDSTEEAPVASQVEALGDLAGEEFDGFGDLDFDDVVDELEPLDELETEDGDPLAELPEPIAPTREAQALPNPTPPAAQTPVAEGDPQQADNAEDDDEDLSKFLGGLG